MRIDFKQLLTGNKVAKFAKNGAIAAALLLSGAVMNEAFDKDVEALQAPVVAVETVETFVPAISDLVAPVVPVAKATDVTELTVQKKSVANVQSVTTAKAVTFAQPATVVAKPATVVAKPVAVATKPVAIVAEVKPVAVTTKPATVVAEVKPVAVATKPATVVAEVKPVAKVTGVAVAEETKVETKISACDKKSLKKDRNNPLHQVNSHRECLIVEAIQLEREGVDADEAWQFYRQFVQTQSPLWVSEVNGKFVYTKEYYAWLLESVVSLQNEVRAKGAVNMTNVMDHVKPEDFDYEIKDLVNKLNNAPGLTPYIIGVNNNEELSKKFGVEQASNEWFNSPMNNPMVRSEGKFNSNYYFENPLLVELYGSPENVRVESEFGNPTAQAFTAANPFDTTQQMLDRANQTVAKTIETINNNVSTVAVTEVTVAEVVPVVEVPVTEVPTEDATEGNSEDITAELTVTENVIIETPENVTEDSVATTSDAPVKAIVLSEDAEIGASEDLTL